MSENGQIVIYFLLGVFLITILVIASRKNFKQILKFFGITWRLESNDESKEKDQPTSSVDFGEGNTFGGKIKNVAGRDIGGSNQQSSTQERSTDSKVDFGKKNEFMDDIDSISGRDNKPNSK